jgi:hypothetical protein
VVAALVGDWAAAGDVQLDLPETGVCKSNPVEGDDTIAAGDGCCGTPATEPELVSAGRGLTTGISGGLLSSPLTLISVSTRDDNSQAGGCCS